MEYNAKRMQKALGVVWLILGLALIGSGNPGGGLFVILGLAYILRTTEQGENWARQNPKIAQWAITGLTLLAVLVVVVTIILQER